MKALLPQLLMICTALSATAGVHVAVASVLAGAKEVKADSNLVEGNPVYSTIRVAVLNKAGDRGAHNKRPKVMQKVKPAQKTEVSAVPKAVKKIDEMAATLKSMIINKNKPVEKITANKTSLAKNQIAPSTMGQFDLIDGASNAGSLAQQDLSSAFTLALLKRLAHNKSYPFRSRLAKQEGVATVTFKISQSGALDTFKIIASSGFSELDQAVVRLFNKSFPLPDYVASLAEGRASSFTIPISFSLTHQS